MDVDKGRFKRLYDQQQIVRYKKANKDVNCTLRINVSLSLNCELVNIVITDDNDPFLLFTSRLDHEMYKIIKQKLGLLVDFSHFPDHLIRLLERCAQEYENVPRLYLSVEEEPSDPLMLVDGACFVLKITEINNFQQLCLIALHLNVGTDKEVTANIASNMVNFKNLLRSCEQNSAALQEKVCRLEAEIMKKNEEINDSKRYFENELVQMKEKYRNELMNEKRGVEQTKADYERKVKELRTEAENRTRSACSVLEHEIEKLKEDIYNLKTVNGRLEASAAEKDEKMSRLLDDIKLLQDEILNSENRVSKLDSECRSKQAMLHNLKQHLSELEHNLEEKEKSVRKLTALLDNAEISKIQLKNSLKEASDNLSRKETELAMVSKDLTKANEIISKINSAYFKVQNKLNIRTKVALVQEKMISEFKEKRDNYEKTIEAKMELVSKLEQENKELKSSLISAETASKEKDEVIKKNEQLISWLSDALAEQSNVRRPILPTVLDPPSVNDHVLHDGQKLGSREKSCLAKTKPSLSQTAQALLNKYSNTKPQPLKKTSTLRT